MPHVFLFTCLCNLDQNYNHSTDANLVHKTIVKLVPLARRHLVKLRHFYVLVQQNQEEDRRNTKEYP